MKRKYLSWLLVTVLPLLATFTSCSDNNDEPKPLPQKQTEILKSYASGEKSMLFKSTTFRAFRRSAETDNKWKDFDLSGYDGWTFNYLDDFIISGGASYVELNLAYDDMGYYDVIQVWQYYGKYLAAANKEIPTIYIKHDECIDLEKSKIEIGPYTNDVVSVSDKSIKLWAYTESVNSENEYSFFRLERVYTATGLTADAMENIATVSSEREGILYIIRTAREAFGDILDVSKLPGYENSDIKINLADMEAQYSK